MADPYLRRPRAAGRPVTIFKDDVAMVSASQTFRSDARLGDCVKGARVLVVEARYYDTLADELLAGAEAAIEAAGAEATVVTVPGALEIPAAIAILIEAAERAGQPYDAAVALGCVIRGETGHYDIVAGESARALMDLSVTLRLPLGNGILTVETQEQAEARARVAEMNKGGGAAEAALVVLALKRAAAAASVGEE